MITTVLNLTLDELWLLQRVVRHEIPGQREMAFPWCSVALNDGIAEAIIMCEDERQTEAHLVVSRGDLLLIDAVVPADAKTPGGQLLGKSVLLKSFRARRELADDMQSTAHEPPRNIAQSVEEFVRAYNDNDADDNANDLSE